MKKNKVAIVSRLSVDSFNFIFNIESILATKENPVRYRFEIEKIENIFNTDHLIACVIDNKLKKKYKIAFNDFFVQEVNPCISTLMYQRIMNYRCFNRKNSDASYIYCFLRYLQSKYLKAYSKFLSTLDEKTKLKNVSKDFISSFENKLKITDTKIMFNGTYKDFLIYLKSELFSDFLRTTEIFRSFRFALEPNELREELSKVKDCIFINDMNNANKKFEIRLNNYLEDAKSKEEVGMKEVMRSLAEERRQRKKRLKAKKSHDISEEKDE